MKYKRITISLVAIIILAGGFYLPGVFDKKKKLVYENNVIENAPSIEQQKIDQDNVERQVQQQAEPKQISANEETKENVIVKENKEQQKPIKTTAKIEEKEVAQNDEKIESSGELKIIDRLMSGGFQKSSDRKIDTIIIHTSYNAIGQDVYDISDIIKQYEQYNVSAHYLIGRDGKIYRLVQDKDIAWHAGVSKMPDGRTNINDFSIGIEVVNTKDGKFTDDQYNALNGLISDLKKKYPVKNILGHADIAPGRKTDPWGIEWDKVKK